MGQEIANAKRALSEKQKQELRDALKSKVKGNMILEQLKNQLKKKLGANYEESMVMAELMQTEYVHNDGEASGEEDQDDLAAND